MLLDFGSYAGRNFFSTFKRVLVFRLIITKVCSHQNASFNKWEKKKPKNKWVTRTAQEPRAYSLGLCKSLPPFWRVNYWQDLRCCLAGRQWHCSDLPLSQESPRECDVCRPGCSGWSCWTKAGRAAHRPCRSDRKVPSGSPWRGGTGWRTVSFEAISDSWKSADKAQIPWRTSGGTSAGCCSSKRTGWPLRRERGTVWPGLTARSGSCG